MISPELIVTIAIVVGSFSLGWALGSLSLYMKFRRLERGIEQRHKTLDAQIAAGCRRIDIR